MEFNSLTFIVFFAIVLLLHNLPLSWRMKKFNLLWASYVFYAAWNPPFVLLLMLATVVDWFAAKGLYAAQTQRGRNAWLAATLISNLGLLGFFKYGNFLLANFTALMNSLGVDYHPPRMNIVLPIGISFYTFVTLSYTLDIYFKKMKPWNSFLDYAMLVTFFPHLVAGPILRAADFLPQCLEEKKPNRDQFLWGLSLLTFGLFQKIVVADYLFAPVVEQVYGTIERLSFADSWMGTLAFAGQIFCDFAGYSTCAIGIAMCLGFAFPRNFRYPYAAVGFSDFWRRWHISLSSWLRDYLYIPLGGNRVGPVRIYVNLMATMLLGGLWHGAAWTFVVWGGLHGLYLVGERLVHQLVPPRDLWQRPGFQMFLAGLTFLLVNLTWVFFRATSFGQAFHLTTSMFGLGPAAALPVLTQSQRLLTGALVLILLAAHWIMRNSTLEEAVERIPAGLRPFALSATLSAMLVLFVLVHTEDRAFIYFQF